MSGTVSKIAAERNQKALMELAMRPGNDQCADCKTRNPRWASHNLGIFICVNCASVHRKIGTHITKVKSLTMDVWTKEQVEHMRQVGNVKSNEMYNQDEVRHPPPANTIDLERDSEIEKFIRDKYEFKRFVSRSRIDRAAIVASHLGPSRSASSLRSSTSSSSFPPSPTRSRTHTLPPPKPSIPATTSAPAAPIRTVTTLPSASANTTMSRSVSQPVSPPAQPPAGGVWSDLASLQGPTQTSTLPLQYLSSTTSPSAPVPVSNLTSNPSTSLGTNFAMAPASHGPSFGSRISPGGDALVSGVTIQPVQPMFALGTGVVNPFAQMAAQQQAQAQQNHPPLASSFGSTLPQQPSFTPQSFTQQIQQPAFSRSVTNPFFNASVPPQGMLSPQPQAPFASMTPSPIPFTGSPFQQPAQVPFQQQPTQMPFQSQPPQFGNGQSSGASVSGNPFTSWITQQPNGYASAHVGQGSVNGPWGSM